MKTNLTKMIGDRESASERGANNRNRTLDIVRGIGIILMVAGHSGAPFTHFIYLFHMAIFFMASGYLWNDKNVSSFGAMKNFCIKRIKGLWIPYLIGNGIFIVLNNLFIRVHIYTNESIFLSLVSEGHLIEPMDFKDTVIALFKIIFFAGGTQLGGATWFFRVLFAISVIHLIVRYISCHWKYGNVVFGLVVILTIVVAELETLFQFRLPMELQSCFAAYFAYLIGMLIQRRKLLVYVKQYEKACFGVALILLLVLNSFGSISMNIGSITNVFYFFVVSVSGWIVCWIIAEHVPGLLQKKMEYLGLHTKWIIILHFLCFKIVSAIYLGIAEKNMVLLATYPVLENVPYLWIFYLIIGVTVPIFLEYSVKRTWGLRIHRN